MVLTRVLMIEPLPTRTLWAEPVWQWQRVGEMKRWRQRLREELERATPTAEAKAEEEVG